MRLVCDASPLIALACVDKLSLLEGYFDMIAVPAAVSSEVAIDAKPYGALLAEWLRDRVVVITQRAVADNLALVLGSGEAEAISLYQELNADYLLMDDLKARSIAQMRGIRIIGTVGILIKAKKDGKIESLRPILEALVSGGVRISRELVATALQSVGEEKGFLE
jgi:hypothetical protein